MKLFRWFILRPLRREPLRSGLTVAGIALGIAVVLAIRLTNESSVRGFAVALDAVSGRTSLEIVGPGIGVDEDLLSELGWLRGFGRLSPVIDGDALVRGLDGKNVGPEQVRVLGVDILRDEAFREYSLADTGSAPVVTTQDFLTLLTDPRALVLTSTFASRHGLAVGDEVELVAGGGAVRLVVRGTLGDDGPASARDGNIALMDIAAAQMALGRLGVVDRVDVQLEDPSAIEPSELAIADRLPPGLSVQRPERRGAQVEKMLAAFHFNLSALSYIALLVGLFLVYNTVSVSVITRRDEIGMLRTVGAGRRTVLALFLGEAVCLACLGCALGAPLGWGLAYLTVGLTSSTVSQFWVASAATVPPLEAADIAIGFAFGLPLAVVAALMPALEAARMTPVAVVRDERNLLVRERLPRRYLAGTACLFGIGGWCATRPPVDDLPLFGLAAALCVVLGAALMTPVVLHGVQRLAARGESRSYEGSTQSIRRTTLTRMAMGTRETDQPPLWIATSDLPTSPGHPFYARLTTLLDGHHFDRFVEGLCDRFYAPVMGRPSLAPGRYFRLLLVGYFEGIDSERGIAWRATDSLAVRSFLRLAVDEAPPDHSTIARTRRLIDLETHRTVFTWVQQRLVEAGRLTGKTIAIDATTLEANAAMRSIVRRDTGESYQAFLAGLATASGVETPTREGLARLDRKRKKKTSNTDWANPHDPDAKVTKMKDGRTHLAHKAEHAVDMETGAIVAVTLQGADVGDTTTIIETAIAATEQVEDAQANVDDRQSLEEIIGDNSPW